MEVTITEVVRKDGWMWRRFPVLPPKGVAAEGLETVTVQTAEVRTPSRLNPAEHTERC